MNKKFSTLVASLLLASGVGAYAQTAPTKMGNPIEMEPSAFSAIGITPDNLLDYDAKDRPVVYKVNEAYFLGTGSAFLSMDGTNKLQMYTSASFTNLDELNNALWILRSVEAPAGAIAPKYVFVNKGTGAVLAMDNEKAGKYSATPADMANYPTAVVGGSTAEWLHAASYTRPDGTNPLYTTLSGDSVATFINDNGEVKYVKMKQTELASNALKFSPYQAKATDVVILSPRQLNTMLGKAGDKATQDNYFQLSFTPKATSNGEDNLWAQDLQAVAVEQFDVLYGQDASKSNQIVVPSSITDLASKLDETIGGIYTSLHPLWNQEKVADANKLYVADLMEEGATDAVDYSKPRWVALRNRDNQYLVVDTFYIDGTNTTQDGSGLIRFGMDALYDSHKDTRRRDPRSYLFQFAYNPVTEQIQIKSYAYSQQAKVDDRVDAESSDPAEWHTQNYTDPFVTEGSRWYNTSNPGNARVKYAWVRRAGLGSTSEITLQNETEETNENMSKMPTVGTAEAFAIKLGSSSQMVETAVSTGAYLIKVVDSKTRTRIGKYWVDNLDGSFAIMEEAVRQNFQHMPAAQWIVKTTGSLAGSPVISITNREFQNQLSSSHFNNEFNPSGTLYVGEKGGKYFMNGDELEFIPVADLKDDKMGYKYVANDTIRESLFTFNYLHELAMDKPINTLNDKDSAVWVDANGNKMSFVLEAVVDDTYGTNGDVTGIADLTRRAYRIKVNDASKLQNDGRYLNYDADQKKYVVTSQDSANVNIFFLKENNEVENGNCYYTLLRAKVVPVVKVKNVAGEGESDDYKVVDRIGYITLDAEAATDVIDGDLYLAKYGKYTSEKDGVLEGTEGWTICTFSPKKANETAEALGFASADDEGSPFVKIEGLLGTGVNNEYKDMQDHYVLKVNADVAPANYATAKVSVDNNSLALVNGELSDRSSSEVANSAFAVVRAADPLYRYFAAPEVVKFFRSNASAPEYLYEDAQSSYSAGKGFNFLGVEGKGDNKNAAMYLDTAYVDRGTRMPQYLIALAPTTVEGEEELCSVCGKADCEHSKVTRTYTDARYLVNLQDSVDYYAGDANYDLRNKYIYDRAYTRLGFVEARHIGDSLIIKNSVYKGDTRQIVPGIATTYASKDTIDLANNLHKNAVFSFRIAKSGSDDFLIESESEGLKEGSSSEYERKKNADLEAVRIAPDKGGWVKIQNGVPVIANTGTYNEVGRDADIFNVEATDEAPTANESAVVTEVSVVAANGAIIVKNAAGKKVAVSNILGQALANAVVASDNETIAVPAGIAVVAVEGEEAVKVVVK